MNDIEIAKLKKFANDTVLFNAVYEVILSSFLKKSGIGQDVHLLAASRLAIDYLGEAWKGLLKFKEGVEDKGKVVDKNIGL